MAELLIAQLNAECPFLERVMAAGGIRRYEPLVDPPIVVACAAEPEDAIAAIARVRGIDDVLYRTGRRLIIVYKQIEIDVGVATARDFGSLLHVATGSAPHLAAMAARKKRSRHFASEEDLYAEARVTFIPPELRQGSGEVEAAATRRLPSLIELEHIRGDLHMHSTYSDGQDSLESMVAAASALGYEYIAITDHSESAHAARTVTLDALERQRDEIARLREKYPTLTILHGLEVDIMPDGRLDFPDNVAGDAGHRPGISARARRPRRAPADSPLSRRHPSSARLDHHASGNRSWDDGPPTRSTTTPFTRRLRPRARRSKSMARRRISTWMESTPARPLRRA